MTNKILFGLCMMVELSCIGGLTYIALKRNSDCYKAKRELISARLELLQSDIDNCIKDVEIRKLKKELEEIQKEESRA